MLTKLLYGVNAAVVAMIASSVLKLSKSTLKGSLSLAIFAAVLVLAFVFDLSPVVLIVAAGMVGFFFGKGGNEA